MWAQRWAWPGIRVCSRGRVLAVYGVGVVSLAWREPQALRGHLAAAGGVTARVGRTGPSLSRVIVLFLVLHPRLPSFAGFAERAAPARRDRPPKPLGPRVRGYHDRAQTFVGTTQ
eukprot:2840202-Pyramimonas_sp.AAC.1